MKIDWYKTYWSVVNSESERERMDKLKQLARDGFNAGAEAQKVADKTAIKNAAKAYGIYIPIHRALAAIQSATVEMPSE